MQPICGIKLNGKLDKNSLKFRSVSHVRPFKYREVHRYTIKLKWGVESDCVHEIKGGQSDTVSKDRQHGKYRYMRVKFALNLM
jgi:hypothetical protein